MAETRQEIYWALRFSIANADGSVLTEDFAQELLLYTLSWVEDHALQMGGGYHGKSEVESELWEDIQTWMDES